MLTLPSVTNKNSSSHWPSASLKAHTKTTKRQPSQDVKLRLNRGETSISVLRRNGKSYPQAKKEDKPVTQAPPETIETFVSANDLNEIIQEGVEASSFAPRNPITVTKRSRPALANSTSQRLPRSRSNEPSLGVKRGATQTSLSRGGSDNNFRRGSYISESSSQSRTGPSRTLSTLPRQQRLAVSDRTLEKKPAQFKVNDTDPSEYYIIERVQQWLIRSNSADAPEEQVVVESEPVSTDSTIHIVYQGDR